MRSMDPMRNFPELDGLPEAEAKALVRDTQKQVTRRPAILIGMIAVLLVAAFAIFAIVDVSGLLGGALMGALIGAVAVGYMVIVIKPRMHEEFRKLGYPKR